MSEPGSNPFATRFIKPGAVPYLFPAGESAEGLIERLRAANWQGEIVAPHGSGKSTLLAALELPLQSAGLTLIRVTLRAGESALPAELNNWQEWTGNTLIIVDGYEQLSWWSRNKLAYRCRQRGAGLLVTSHAATGLPRLLEIQNNLATAEQVVRQLGVSDEIMPRELIEQAYHACDGNLREMLFRLYDVYERMRSVEFGVRKY